MKITLAAIPYYWPRSEVVDFYARLCRANIDVVYLGESVCSKRSEMTLDDWLAIAAELQRAGKEVVLTSLALITGRNELQMMKRICAQGLQVEANDTATVQQLHELGQPFICGSSINIYNAPTLQYFARLGMRRWVVPVELAGPDLAALLAQTTHANPIETEILGWGKLPLAYSARCYTARAHNRPKDACKKICIDYPRGMAVSSQENTGLFTLNGIQTLSASPQDLRALLPQVRSAGVTHFRVVPELDLQLSFFDALEATISGDAQPVTIASDACNGYWFGAAGMTRK